MRRFFWKNLPGTDHVGRIGRSNFVRNRVMPLHDHQGMAEVFRINAGQGVHMINGRREILEKGDVAFIREHDCHSFTGLGEDGLTITNLAMKMETIRHLRDRHFAAGCPSETPGLFWHAETENRVTRLTPKRLREVENEAEELSLRSPNQLEVERFVLNLASMILETGAGSGAEPGAHPMPAWLSQALRRMEEFRPVEELSVGKLVHACRRSPEHVARVLRRCTGLTPSAWVRRRRIRYAAHLMAMTDADLTTIALDCGFSGISYFYQVFRDEYGTSPARYRRDLGAAGVSGGVLKGG